MNMHTPPPSWKSLTTSERRDLVRDLWASGLSYGLIAALFDGASRCAVAGVIHRAKMPKRITTKSRPPKPRGPDRIKRDRPKMTTELPEWSAAELIDISRPPLAGHAPISIMELPHRIGVRCRFPVQGGYCGAPSADRSYCPDHAALAYRPTEPITRPPKEARL